tara:strand:- start:182 stop:481 length:300 start_codon:yes stop_codon:yes gene_type:complete
MAEYESWVPMVKNAMHDVPRPLGWALAAALLVATCVYSPQSAVYLSIVAAGNVLLWRMEQWTATRDRAAVAAGVPTSGWGSTNRMQEQREVRRKAESKE